MGEKLIGIIVCLLCAIPYYTIAILGKNSQSPITFFSGDKSLKVKDIKKYNLEMFKLYTFYGTIFIFGAISFIFSNALGMFILLFNATIGIGLVYIKYRWILNRSKW